MDDSWWVFHEEMNWKVSTLIDWIEMGIGGMQSREEIRAQLEEEWLESETYKVAMSKYRE